MPQFVLLTQHLWYAST